jgi:O-antigen/teichoic acid export membrane protein
MRLGRNLLAGIVSSAWTALIGLAVVPLYLKYLGLEAYGLVGFFTVAQSLLQILDLGLVPTVTREVARRAASRGMNEAANLLHTLAVVYWSVAALIGLSFVSIAPLIAKYWLQSNHLPPNTITHALVLMGLVVACRWPVALYQGALMGAERLTVSSGISIAMVTLGNAGAVCVLALVSPTIQAFFIWQAVAGLAYAVTTRWAAWRVLGRTEKVRFDVAELKRTWRFSAGVSGIALSSLLLLQMDKILLSKILTLEDFGRYMLASLIASGLYLILTPVFNAVYPRMSALVSNGDTAELTDFYRSGTRLLLAVLFPTAITASVFSRDLVAIWTRNPGVASAVAPIVSLFLIGTMLNGAMHFPYALQLAYGNTRLPLKINIILLVVTVPMVITLAEKFGGIGGAAAWAILNFVFLLVGTWLTHRSLLKGIGGRWLLHDVAMPLALALLIVGIGGGVIRNSRFEPFVRLFVGGLMAFLTFAVTILISPSLLSFARNSFTLEWPPRKREAELTDSVKQA